MPASPSPGRPRNKNARRTTVKQRRHQHVLDVSVRNAQAARQRNHRLLGWTVKLLLVVGVCAGLYYGVRKGIASLLLKNPDYSLAELNVETDGVLDPATVLAAADLHKGSNIFLIDLNRAKSRVEAIPQVEKAQVTRQLPRRITIQINERKPIAWVAPERSSPERDAVVHSPDAFLVDAHSVLLPPAETSQDSYLPIIRNYHGPRSSGQEAEGEEIKAALDLLQAQQDSMIAARFQVQDIDLAKHFGLEVTDRNGLQVLFGLEDMDRQLKRLDVDLQVLDQNGQKPQTINLLVQKNVPVTFVTEPADAPPAPVVVAASVSPAPSPAKNAVPGKHPVPTSGKESREKKSVSARKASTSTKHPQQTKRGLQPFGATP